MLQIIYIRILSKIAFYSLCTCPTPARFSVLFVHLPSVVRLYINFLILPLCLIC